MYLSYYNLKVQPFQLSADPKFLWLGEKHKEALATLNYAILENKGFFLLTGDVGTGKTTLINALINGLGKEIIIAKSSYPGLDTLEFFNFIGNEFKMNKMFSHKGDFLVHLDDFLNNAYENNKKALVIIDEAQCMKQELLNNMRLLSNIERQNTRLINLFFVGNNEFNDILLDTANSNLRQRITIKYHIDTLTKNEVAEYVRYRLKIAGSEQDIFTSEAICQIFSFSGGCPRLINTICDHALLTGYAKEKKTIDAGILKECTKKLRITTQRKKKGTDLEFVKTTEKKLTKRRPILYIVFFVIVLIIVGYLNKGFLSQDTSTTKKLESDYSFQTVKTNKNKLPMAGNSGSPDKIWQQDISSPSHKVTAQGEKKVLSAKRSIPRLHHIPEPVLHLQEIKDLKVTRLVSSLKPIKLEPVEIDRPDRLLEDINMPDIPDISGPDIFD
ncbi:MAG: AAA family ATPase [Desulfobacterales bacterium]|nr:AAA family ATPase [Desulfobacterales bacterium]